MPGRGLHLGARLSAVAWFLLGCGFLLALPVLWGIYPLSVIAIAVLALVLALPTAGVTRFVLDRGRRKTFLGHWVTAGVALTFLLCVIAAAPMYYLAGVVAADPLTAPQTTLSNGKKTVIFQGMSHIGSETFYKTVVYDLEHALSDGYVVYYEGVKPDPAGDAWFSKTLAGGGNLNARYKQLSEVCGLAFQGDYFQLLARDIREHPDSHVAADVSTLDMKREYERLMAADPDFAAKARKTAEQAKDDGASAAVLTRLLKWTQDGDPRRKSLAGTACRGFLDVKLHSKTDKPPGDLDPLLLDFRNRVLVDRLLADPRPRIYINYGSDHLPGVLKLLRASDPNWTIVSTKWMRALEAPETLHGKLPS